MDSRQISEIRNTAIERLNFMTEYCSIRDGYPNFITDLFYLYSYIACRSAQKFYNDFGCVIIDVDHVKAAKSFFNYPPISRFEMDCISGLSTYLEAQDRATNLLPMKYGDNQGKVVNS
jgi:hypothetical protein